MANGFSLGLLQFQADITKNATPQYKVDPYGFLASLYAAHSRGVIKNVVGETGHTVTVKVKRKKRLTQASTRNYASCDNVVMPSTLEDTVDIAGYCEISIAVEEETIAQFDTYASRQVPLRGAGTSLMYEFFDDVQIAANALLQCVDDYLVTKAVDAIGENVRTGNATAATINIALNTTNNPLADGPTQIFADLKQNSMYGNPVVVGAGLFHNYMVQQPAKFPDQAGVNTRILTSSYDFWYDQNIGVELAAADNIIVYEKDAVQIVEHLVNKGFRSGLKPTGDLYGTLMLPFIVGEQLIPIEFDYHLRYVACAEDITIEGYGGSSFSRGWIITLSKKFDLYTIPDDAYLAGDPLENNRGSLLYNITNT